MKTPLLPLLMPFMLGILIANGIGANWSGWMAALGALTTVGLLLFQWRTDKAYSSHSSRFPLFEACLLFIFFSLGFSLTQIHRPEPLPKAILNEPSVLMEAEVAEMPKLGDSRVKFVAKVQHFKTHDTLFSSPCKILFLAEKDSVASSLHQGDKLLIYSRLLQPQKATNPHQFDYHDYLYHKGIVAQSFLAPYAYRVIGHQSSFLSRISSLRDHTLEGLRQSDLSPSQRGIAEALLLGWKNDVDPSTTAQFRNAGITHLLCVSGLHVGIVAALLGACLSWIRGRRYSHLIKGILQLAGVWFFVFLTGMAPSTMRAAIMFSFIIVGHLLHLRPSTLNSVAASALLLLTINPFLLFDVGFQLSYAAVAGIILMTPGMNALFPWNQWQYSPSQRHELVPTDRRWKRWSLNALEKIWSLICVTTAAQLATMPLVVLYFHQFPLYFIIANLTVIPLAGILMGTLLIMVFFRWWHWLSALSTWLFSVELQGIDRITNWISNLPHALLSPLYFDGKMALILGLWVCLLGWVLSRKGSPRLLIPQPPLPTPRWAIIGLIALPLLLAAYGLATGLRQNAQQEWIIYSSTKATAIEIISQRESLLVLTDSTTNASDLSYEREENLIHHYIRKTRIVNFLSSKEDTFEELRLKPYTVQWKSNRILCLDRNNIKPFVAQSEHIEADYLLLSQSPYIGVDQLRHHCSFDTLLIAAQNSPRYRQAWIRECNQLEVPYIDLSKGALVRR